MIILLQKSFNKKAYKEINNLLAKKRGYRELFLPTTSNKGNGDFIRELELQRAWRGINKSRKRNPTTFEVNKLKSEDRKRVGRAMIREITDQEVPAVLRSINDKSKAKISEVPFAKNMIDRNKMTILQAHGYLDPYEIHAMEQAKKLQESNDMLRSIIEDYRPSQYKMTYNKPVIPNPKKVSLEKKVANFSDTRENASPELIEKAKTSGVIQKVNGEWRIVAIKKKKLWNAHYKSKENAEAALRGYQANKH